MLPPYTRVEMARNTSGTWEVQTPTGSLDLSKSKTQGLQEAMDHAAANGLDLHVQGGIYEEGAAAKNLIQCAATLRVPPLENAYWSLRGVTLDFTAGGADDGILVDSVLHSELTFNCSIHYRGTGAAFHLHPRNPLGGASVAMAIDSSYKIARLRLRQRAGGTGLQLTGPNVARNRFDLIEIEGELDAATLAPIMDTGIGISKTGSIFSNWFTVQSLLRARKFGIDDHGAANQYRAHIEVIGLEAAAVRASGSDCLFTLDMSAGQGQFGAGVLLAYGAERNSFIVTRNDAGMPVINRSGNDTNRFI